MVSKLVRRFSARPHVLYLDNHVLAVNKPAGMPCCPDSSRDPDVLSTAKKYLKDRFQKPGNAYLSLVHRLDRPTSGVMILARTSKAASRISKSFRERLVKKQYLAIVRGILTGSGALQGCVTKRDAKRVYLQNAENDGLGEGLTGNNSKFASLQFESIRTFHSEGGQFSLVRVTPETGRKHQIRIQLSEYGFPIVGDIK
eukprot:jgi/Bigna1/126551/aug1.2_g1259